jgi:hypothetical protein
MKLRINSYTFASAVFSIITAIIFFVFSKLFNEIIIFYIGIPFALSIFFFILAVLRYDTLHWSFKIANTRITDIFLYTLTIASVIIVLLVPAYGGSMLEWMCISPLNWLRYLSSLLLTSFLPGYFLLKIFDRKHVITGSIVIVLSYLLSLFITFLAGFSISLSANPLEVLGLQIIITTNIALIITHYFTNREKTRNYLLTVDWTELGLILSILAVITVGTVIVMINNMPLTSGDMLRHYGTALEYSKGFHVYGGRTVTYYGGYLFSIYLGILFVLSGIPPALAEQGLYILSFMPLLAFYLSIKAWLNTNPDQKMASKATMFSTLLGFGGLYALYLRFACPAYDTIQLLGSVTSKTYDIYMRILYLPDIVAPLWNIGLPVFFTLLYLLKTKRSTLTNAATISILVALGYLGHASEIFFFILILFIYVLFLRRRNEEKIGPYIVLGLAVVALVDFVAPAQVYVLSGAGTVLSLPFVVSLILAALTSVAELVKDRCAFLFSMELRNSLLEKLGKGWRYGRWVLIYIYVFFFVIWLTVVKDFNLWDWGGFTFTPFFVLPLRLGVVGLLAILSIAIYFSKIIKNRTLLFFLLLIPIGFILEQTANYYQLYYDAYRFGTITFVGACVIAAYGIINGIDKIRSTKRKMITCVLLGFLMISGMLSTALFYVNASYYSINSKISQDELDALDYIRQNTLANASVLTFTTESANNLRNFAGLNPVQDAQRWSQLLSTSNPYIITYILSSSNIKYIYVTQNDAELLSTVQLSSFLKYFPKVFKNDYATVYEVPPLTAPSPGASFGVLHFSPSIQKIADTTWIDDSFTEGWYPYRQYGEVKNYTSKVSNGIMEISVTSNQSGGTWASYALSELSLNTTIYPTLSFRYNVANNLTWFTLQLWNSTNQVFLYVGHLSATDFTTKVLTLPENQTITRIEIIVETVKDAPADTTAHAYIDCVKFSAPTSTWKEDTFLSDWEFYKTYGNVSDYSAHSNGDIVKINVTSNQSGTVWASYSLPLELKTKDSVLSFRYKVDNNSTWFTIILQNATHRFFFYRGHLTDRVFTTKSYPLPDGQTITRIELIVETTDNAPPQTSAVAQIDYIGISQPPFSEDDILPSLFVSLLHSPYTVTYIDDLSIENIDTYLSNYTNIILPSDPQFPIESLLKWVSAGNTLTVFNTYGNGFFANLPGINNSSPTTSVNNINSGKVLYINTLPKIAVGEESDILQPDFLKEVKILLTIEEYVQKIDTLPVYNSIFGGIQIQGDLEVNTDILMLQGAINLPNSPFLVNESTEIKIYGKINLTIKNATLSISPSESYMLIKPDNYPIEGEIFVNASEPALIIADGNVIYNSDAPVSFKFKTTGISLSARLPSINASGTITFDQLDVHAALYIPLAGIVQQKAEIQGSVKFDITYVSNPVTIFSMFQAEGKILNLAETITSRPTIPWTEVLSSHYNIAFNAAFLLSIAIYMVKKRKAKPTINKR